MTISVIPPSLPANQLLINRRLVARRIDLGHVNEAVATAAILFTFQIERELAAGVIDPELAVRKASVICRVACFSHPDRTGGQS